MGDQFAWILEVAIHPGQLENFKSVARDLIASSQNEPGTLQYEWHLSDDGAACHICERYTDSAAFMLHVQSFGKFGERFLQACHPVRFHIYGSPSPEARAALADFQPTYFSRFGGFNH